MITAKHCPCKSGLSFTDCCEAVLSGQKKAATAEALMRSRYSAYAKGDIAYLLRTWHSSTRPPAIDPDTIPDWCGLDIIRTDKGQVGDDEGIVEFKATAALSHGKILILHEVSHFVREAGQWLYVSGNVIGDSSQGGCITEKVGRNCLCPCGSGKKFKKCCGP
jgi:SEC-C motif domain protein